MPVLLTQTVETLAVEHSGERVIGGGRGGRLGVVLIAAAAARAGLDLSIRIGLRMQSSWLTLGAHN